VRFFGADSKKMIEPEPVDATFKDMDQDGYGSITRDEFSSLLSPRSNLNSDTPRAVSGTPRAGRETPRAPQTGGADISGDSGEISNRHGSLPLPEGGGYGHTHRVPKQVQFEKNDFFLESGESRNVDAGLSIGS